MSHKSVTSVLGSQQQGRSGSLSPGPVVTVLKACTATKEHVTGDKRGDSLTAQPRLRADLSDPLASSQHARPRLHPRLSHCWSRGVTDPAGPDGWAESDSRACPLRGRARLPQPLLAASPGHVSTLRDPHRPRETPRRGLAASALRPGLEEAAPPGSHPWGPPLPALWRVLLCARPQSVVHVKGTRAG